MKRHALLSLLFVCTLGGAAELTDETTNKPNPVHLHMFHGAGCVYCDKLQVFLEKIKPDYPSLIVHEYEVYGSEENRAFMQKMATAYDTPLSGVPMTFVGSDVIVGFSKANGEKIKGAIESCLQQECENPADRIEGPTPTQSQQEKCPDLKTQTLTISAVVCAAAVDAINPCAFAVLTILLATILASSTPLNALLAGLAFCLAIFISYFLMGLGMYTAFAASGISYTLYVILAFLALLLGLFNIKDYLGYRGWFTMGVPHAWRPSMKALLRGVTSVPGAFLVGFVVSLFLLPCTSGPYLVILGMLAHTTSRNYAMALLALYNFIFVAPMLVITLAIYFGFTTAEQAEQWRKERIDLLRLIAGVLLIALSIAMLASIYLGMV